MVRIGIVGIGFRGMKQAYEVLMDDAARDFYDRLGIVPDSAEAREIQAAYHNLGQLFGQLLMQIDLDALPRTDIVGKMRDAITGGIAKNEGELKKPEENEVRSGRSGKSYASG